MALELKPLMDFIFSKSKLRNDITRVIVEEFPYILNKLSINLMPYINIFSKISCRKSYNGRCSVIDFTSVDLIRNKPLLYSLSIL